MSNDFLNGKESISLVVGKDDRGHERLVALVKVNHSKRGKELIPHTHTHTPTFNPLDLFPSQSTSRHEARISRFY